MLDVEYPLVPTGLHVTGKARSALERVDMLLAMCEAGHSRSIERAAVVALVPCSNPWCGLGGPCW